MDEAQVDWIERAQHLMAQRRHLTAEDFRAILMQASLPGEEALVGSEPAAELVRRLTRRLGPGVTRTVDWQRVCELLEQWPPGPGQQEP